MNKSFVVWGDTGTGAAKYHKSSTGSQPGQVGRSSEAIENSGFPLKRLNVLKNSDKGRTSKYWYIL